MNNDPLFWNKIAGAVLSAGLLAMVTGFAAHLLYNPVAHAPEKQAYQIAEGVASPSTESQAEKPAGPEPISGMLAEASVEDGQKVAKKCAACHTFEKGGANKVGPNLWNTVGSKPAGTEGYNYSSGMKGAEHDAWGYEELNKYLYKPRDFVKGTKMTFAGVKKASDRADLIAYLRTLSDNPKPLP